MRREAPTELVLGDIQIPLPIAPIGERGKRDKHHAFFPKKAKQLKGMNKRPVRWSRLQHVDYRLHRRYHTRHDYMWLPETEEQYFKLTLLNAANYIPRHAVDVSSRHTRNLEIPESMRRRMQREQVMHQEDGRKWAIGFFLANYVVRNGLEAITDSQEVVQFVEAKDRGEQWSSAFNVMRAATSVVLDPVEPTYERARREGNIRQSEPTAARFLLRLFDGRQPDYIPEINRQLSIA